MISVQYDNAILKLHSTQLKLRCLSISHNKVIQNQNTQSTSVQLIQPIIINLKEVSVNKRRFIDWNPVNSVSLVNG